MQADFAIREATVIDGSGGEPFVTDVEISAGVITRLGNVGRAAREIVASGLILTPGFVDVHSHDDAALLWHPEMDFKLLQGCTSVVIGNCGFSLSPARPGGAEPPGNASLFDGLRSTWTDLTGFQNALRAAKPSINALCLVGHNAIRALVLNGDERTASQAEIHDMRALVTQALEQGACGLSTGLIYRPGRSSTTEEIVEIASALKAFDALYTTHMRSESDALLEALEEALRVGEAAGCKIQISHHKAAGKKNWGKVIQTLARIDRANADGLDVALDVYPYAAGSGPMVEYFDLSNIDTELASVIRVASCPAFPAYESKMLTELASELRMSLEDVVRQILTAPAGERTLCITFTMAEQDVERNLCHPRAMIGSDGLPTRDGRPHPRLYGTFPRVLAEYTRTRGLLSIEQAVHKMTGLPCARFGLKNRGFVREGYFADLVLFDPAQIRDAATYDSPRTPPLGISIVMVNGYVAAESGRTTGERAGRPLRYRNAV
jgi:N-acyl-D-aspartate/D-glutamate deacylase